MNAEIEQARMTSDYWKSEHNAANKEIERLRAALRDIRIYIVIDDVGKVVRAFNVEHECVSWLSTCKHLPLFSVLVCRDGGMISEVFDSAKAFMEKGDSL